MTLSDKDRLMFGSFYVVQIGGPDMVDRLNSGFVDGVMKMSLGQQKGRKEGSESCVI